MVKTYLTNNQERIVESVNTYRREEPFFYSRNDEKKYYLSELRDTEPETLRLLVGEMKSELCILEGTIEEYEMLARNGKDSEAAFNLRIKKRFVVLMLKKAMDCINNRRESRELLTKRQRMQIAYENEFKKIFYDKLISIVGKQVFMKLMFDAKKLANQTHPNPALDENKHLWEKKK